MQQGGGAGAAEQGVQYDDRTLDYALVATLVTHILQMQRKHKQRQAHGGGEQGHLSVLVFASGAGEIDRICTQLRRRVAADWLWLLPLHGGLSAREQQRVFQRAPVGQTKVVVATNVAETSITIEDVGVVVDTLRSKQLAYEPLQQVRMVDTQFYVYLSLVLVYRIVLKYIVFKRNIDFGCTLHTILRGPLCLPDVLLARGLCGEGLSHTEGRSSRPSTTR